MRLSVPATRWLLIALLLAFWEIAARAGWIAELFLPPLTTTIAAAVENYRQYAGALAVTLYEVAVSLVLACGGGIVTGAIIGSVPLLRTLLLPLISSFYAIPLVIIYPLFVVWLGLGSPSKIAFASIIGFFPAALSTAAGIQTIDPQLVLAARSMGATTWQRLRRVLIPAAIPTVLSGLRLGGALTIVGVVLSEMLVSSHGIGYLITFYRQSLDGPRIYAAILLVLALAVGFDAFVQLLERRTSAWRPARRAEQAAPRS
ncbi:MAG TPA: ABC transporter permease [Xanthobacteraceae bacterium]|nr:ABC transporter permease [Xanthobacteraceae bacterium]